MALCIGLAPLACGQLPVPCDLLKSTQLAQAAQLSADAKKPGLAAGQFRDAYLACPSRHELLLELSRAAAAARNFPEAIQAAKEYLDRVPDSVEGHLLLGNAYLMSVQLDDALAQAQAALKLQPAGATALKLKANTEYLLGKLDLAAATLVGLLDRHPNDEEAAYMLGRVYFQDGRVDHAMGAFQRVLKLNPKSYKAYDNLGLCYEARGEKDAAIRHFLAAVKLVETDHPEYDLVYANLANLLLENGDAEKAYGAAAKAAERNPLSARNFYLGGKALSMLNKTDLALNWLERSAALDSSYPEPLYLLARLYRQLGQPDKAKQAMARFQAVKARTPRERR